MRYDTAPFELARGKVDSCEIVKVAYALAALSQY